MIELIRQGLSPSTASRVAEYSGLSKEQLLGLLGSQENTLSKGSEENKLLDSISSDRLYRVARTVALAMEAFEDGNKARRWLHKPNRALGGGAPLEQLDTDAGIEQVLTLFNRIEYGVYS